MAYKDVQRASRIAEQLGMSHGAASNRLRKLILFDLLQKHKENFCFKCNGTIGCADDLSIEHKLPWEGRSVNLFWSLENIAFSHTDCNMPHIYRGGTPLRKTGLEGTSWCSGCRVFEPIENFWKDSSNWNGLQKYCKKTKIK